MTGRQGSGQGTHKGRPYGVGDSTPGWPRAGELQVGGRNMLRPYGLTRGYEADGAGGGV